MRVFPALRWLLTAAVLLATVWLWQSSALLRPPEARILWATESEVNTAGFHVYRAPAPVRTRGTRQRHYLRAHARRRRLHRRNQP